MGKIKNKYSKFLLLLNLYNGKIKRYYYLMLKDDLEKDKIENKFIMTNIEKISKTIKNKLGKNIWFIRWFGNEDQTNVELEF